MVGVVEHVNRGRGNAIFAPTRATTASLAGDATIEDRVDVGGRGVRLRLSGGAFFQANRDVAALAYAAIARRAGGPPGRARRRRLLRRRAASRWRSRARGATEVIGIEEHAGAVADAAASAALNGVTNARFVAGDVAELARRLERADVVVLNPPRKAARPRSSPRSSASRRARSPTCPAIPTRSRATSPGSRPAATGRRCVTPYDMLPHTPHVEALAIARADVAANPAARALLFAGALPPSAIEVMTCVSQ